jgi:TPR repeat protein
VRVRVSFLTPALLSALTQLEYGEGVDMNKEESVRYYRLAADQGLALGQYYLAQSLESGAGCEKDVRAALILYQQALDQGERGAQMRLQRLLAKHPELEQVTMTKSASKR